MSDDVVGWLTGPRSSVYHRDQAHAEALIGDGGLYPVTATEADKFGLTPCARCVEPEAKPVPENVLATSKALRKMFVVDGTEAELNQMAEDFLVDLAEFGFTVRRIPRRAKNTTDTVTYYGVDVVAVDLNAPIDFSEILNQQEEPTT